MKQNGVRSVGSGVGVGVGVGGGATKQQIGLIVWKIGGVAVGVAVGTVKQQIGSSVRMIGTVAVGDGTGVGVGAIVSGGENVRIGVIVFRARVIACTDGMWSGRKRASPDHRVV